LALATAGAKVAVNFVSGPEHADRVVQEIQAGGNDAMAIRADVSQETEVEAMFVDGRIKDATTVAAFGLLKLNKKI
jgi:NAD(P)-dependent dehydrogenase (short-subunit alcohol dehydrogenase family)